MFSKEMVCAALSPGNCIDIYLQHDTTSGLLFSFSKFGVTEEKRELSCGHFLYTLRIKCQVPHGLLRSLTHLLRLCSWTTHESLLTGYFRASFPDKVVHLLRFHIMPHRVL